MGMLIFRELDYNCGRKGIPQLKNSIEKKKSFWLFGE